MPVKAFLMIPGHYQMVWYYNFSPGSGSTASCFHSGYVLHLGSPIPLISVHFLLEIYTKICWTNVCHVK